MTSPTQTQINNWFTYHSPKPGQPERYEAVRAAGKEFASLFAYGNRPQLDALEAATERFSTVIRTNVPDGHERQNALRAVSYAVTDVVDGVSTHLVIDFIRDAVMWANAAIACEEA